MRQRPSRVIRSAEVRAQIGKPRTALRGELNDLRAENVAQESYLARLRPLTNLKPRTGACIPTVTLSTPGTFSVAYDIQIGDYTRVANRVFFDIRLRFTPTLGTGSGSVRIGGLPFVVGAASGIGYVAILSGFTWPGILTKAMITALADGTNDYFRLFWLGDTSPTAMDETALNSGSQHTLYFGGSYATDED